MVFMVKKVHIFFSWHCSTIITIGWSKSTRISSRWLRQARWRWCRISSTRIRKFVRSNSSLKRRSCYFSVAVMVVVVNSTATVVLVLINNKQQEINLEKFVIFMNLFSITKEFDGWNKNRYCRKIESDFFWSTIHQEQDYSNSLVLDHHYHPLNDGSDID